MFAVLNFIDCGKRKIRRSHSIDTVNEVVTSQRERYYEVNVLKNDKGVNWEEVSAFIGIRGRNVLADRNIILTERHNIKRFEPIDFVNLLLFNTVSFIMKEVYLAGLRTRCYIIDPDGKNIKNLRAIAKYSPETIVLTDNKYKYINEAEKLYRDIGAGVTVTDKSAVSDNFAVVIDTTGKAECDVNRIVFSPYENGLHPLYVDGYSELTSLCPNYIDTIDFLGALYSMNNEKSLSDAMCRVFSYGGRKVTSFEAAETVKKRICRYQNSNKSIIFFV